MMPGHVVAALVVAALLHAGWNAAIRGGGDRTIATVLVGGGSGVLALLCLPFVPMPDPACLPWLAASVGLQLAYYVLIALAYRDGGMAFVYPLMRGTAVMLVALFGTVLGQRVSPSQGVGIAVLCAGIAAQALGHRGTGRSGLYAVANAVLIAAYTLVDSVGVRHAGTPTGYAAAMFALTGLPVLAWGLAVRRDATLRLLRDRPAIALLGGGGTLGSYAIVLWALSVAPAAPVAALRETSILFAILIGKLFLGERLQARHIVATTMIVAGAVIVRMG